MAEQDQDPFVVCSSPKLPELDFPDDKPRRRKWYRCDKRFVVDVLTLAALVVAAVVYKGQLSEMTNANTLAMANARISDQATAASLRLTREGLDLTRQSNERAQRARVLVDHFNKLSLASKTVALHLNMKNYGQITASGMAASKIYHKVLPVEREKAHLYVARDLAKKIPILTTRGGDLGPGAFATHDEQIELTEEELTNVKAGRWTLYLYGRILYSDEFTTLRSNDEQRRTDYCVFWFPSENPVSDFANCHLGNRAL